MDITRFNRIINTVTHRYISCYLYDNSAVYYGDYNGQKVIVRFENLGFQREIIMNNKRYCNFKLDDNVQERMCAA